MSLDLNAVLDLLARKVAEQVCAELAQAGGGGAIRSATFKRIVRESLEGERAALETVFRHAVKSGWRL